MDSKNTELKAWCNAKRGRYTSLANHLQCAVSFVSKMADGEKPIPLDLCDRIEAHTGIACEVLRPDRVEYFTYMRKRPINTAGVDVGKNGITIGIHTHDAEASLLADVDAMVSIDKAA